MEPLNPNVNSDFFRLLCDQAGFGMIATDMQGRIVSWNLAVSEMFGSSATQMIGTSWEQVIPVEGREIAGEMMGRTLSDGESAEFEFWHRDQVGQRRYLAANTSPVMDADGNQVAALACIRDITNRVVLQNRISYQAKMVAMGEMAGALSHHLNNILGGVVTSVDFALSSTDPNVLSRALVKIQGSMTKAATLMDSVLKFAEGDSREVGLCDLGEVLIDLIERTERKLDKADIGLKVDLHLIPVLEVPRAQLLTVLTNIVDNAIESMKDGGELSIQLDVDDDDAVVRILDTGCGMEEDRLARVFEPFYSTKYDERTNRPRGGLGLAVAHGIIKVLGGSIQVGSTLGVGTNAEIRIPLRPGKRDWS